jgi:purine-nucleoside phosphorylase
VREMGYFDQVFEAAEYIRARVERVPGIAVVLGSGLGDLAGRVANPVTLAYVNMPNWPPSGVVGHAGKLVIGDLAGKRVIVLSGRAHYYEGHSLLRSTFSIRVMGLLGVKTLILTNAAGGINTSFESGALMAIDDHINLFGTNPLIGPNEERFGPRFPDMTDAYSKRLRALADTVAAERGIELAHGIYAALHGPSYETPAEIRFLRTIGADAVGMSTAPETIVARHMGIEVLAISCITNMAAGVLDAPLDHAEVMATATRVKDQFMALVEGTIQKL